MTDIYPPPPPPPPPEPKRQGWLRRHKILTAFGVLVVLIIVAAIAGGDEADDAAATSTTAASETPPTQDVYAIGDTAHTSVFDVTVHQVIDPWQSGNQFETPTAGHRFVAVEASLTNTEGDELETWSSLLGAELSDGQGRPWNVALAGSELPALDGDVGRGMTRQGWVVFDVGADATGLTLRLKGELTATGSLFDLEPGS